MLLDELQLSNWIGVRWLKIFSVVFGDVGYAHSTFAQVSFK